MIQDIAPKIYDGTFHRKDVEADSIVFCMYANQVLMRHSVEHTFPTYQELSDAGYILEKKDCQFLFQIEDQTYFLWKNYHLSDDQKQGICGFSYQNIRSVREFALLDVCLAASTAYHLFVWYRDNQFCGRCGSRLIDDYKERMRKCPECGNMVYPKIAPAVIVGVTNGDRILMTKYADREYKKYALIAGFCEIGETAEDTVRREVFEEVGLHVKNIRYYKSQPWGFDSNLLLGFFADLDGSDHITRQEDELAVAEWVAREKTTGMDDGVSLTREMMDLFSKGLECAF